MKKVQLKLAFLYLIAFPLGQLLRIENVFGRDLPIYPTDIIIGISFVLSLAAGKRPFPRSFSAIFNFWIIATFSLIFSLAFFMPTEILTGALYLVRFVAYSFYFVSLWRMVRENKKLKQLIINSLIAIGVFVAIFGSLRFIIS